MLKISWYIFILFFKDIYINSLCKAWFKINYFYFREDKIFTTYRKIASILQNAGDHSQAADTLKVLISKINDSKLKTEAWRDISKILSSIKDLPDDDILKVRICCFNIIYNFNL